MAGFSIVKQKLKIVTGIFLVFGLVYGVYLASALSIPDFKELTPEELSDWNLESMEIIEENLDYVWYFEMDTYAYYEVTDIMREQRELFSLSCYQELNCTQFYSDQLEVLQENLLLEYLEWQDEL